MSFGHMGALGTGFGRAGGVGGSSHLARIALSAGSQDENTATNTTIGTLSVVNGNGVYTFAESVDADNVFTVTGTSLKNSAVFDYETATSHQVTVTADNGVDPILSRTFTILVTDVVEVTGTFRLLSDGASFRLLANGTDRRLLA